MRNDAKAPTPQPEGVTRPSAPKGPPKKMDTHLKPIIDRVLGDCKARPFSRMDMIAALKRKSVSEILQSINEAFKNNAIRSK